VLFRIMDLDGVFERLIDRAAHDDDNDDTGDPKDVDPTADIIQLLKNKN